MAAADTQLRHLSDAQRARLEAWRIDFERSWHEKLLRTRARDLANLEEPLRLPALVEMVKIDLERQWQKSRPAKLEGYLSNYPELGTPDTVAPDLIRAEFEVRQQFGGSADLADFGKRFPRQLERLRELLRPGAGAPPRSSPAAQETHVTAGSVRRTFGPDGPGADVPEQFGRYRILKKLGAGGMGAVYLARDTHRDREVARKLPLSRPADGSEELERFYREARAAAALKHPNICPVYDVGEIDGRLFLTREFVEGAPRTKFLEGGKPVPPAQAVRLVHKLATVLHEAHKKGIVHRDLKPANIRMRNRKEPVVRDFGLARRIGKEDVRLTTPGAVRGTPAYRSPEQVGGDVEAMGPGCDVGTLGVIFYELRTGQLPFRGPGLAIFAQIVNEPPKPPSSLRPGLDPRRDAVCLKAMAKKIEDRYASMADFARALKDCLASPPDDTSRLSQPALAGAAAEASPFADLNPTDGSKTQAQVNTERPSARGGKRWGLLAGVGAALLALGVGAWLLAGVVLTVKTKDGILEIVTDEPNLDVFVDGEKVTVTWGEGGKKAEIRVKSGTREVSVERDGVVVHGEKVEVKEGGRHVLRARVVQGPPPAGGGPKPEEKPTPAGGDWVPLFNGKNLSGWKPFFGPNAPADTSKVWTVKDRTLICDGSAKGYLRTEKEYGDYALRLQWKWGTKRGGNFGFHGSGIFLHAQGPDGLYPKSVEVEFSVGRLGALESGDLVLFGGFRLMGGPEGKAPPLRRPGRDLTAYAKVRNAERPVTEWNTCEITCRGDTIQVVLNDQLVNQGIDAGHTRGWILLESVAVPIHFRNIEIKDLKPGK